jgi:excisionase family DNA binding protein
MSQTHPQKKTIYSIVDVTDLTGLGRSFIYEAIKAGNLSIRKAGRRTLIFEADLNSWLASMPVTRSANSKLKSNTP